MVDSNDRDHVVEARDELHRMLNEVWVYLYLRDNLARFYISFRKNNI